MKQLLSFLFAWLVCLALFSCSSGDDELYYDYLPVKLSGSELWSIMKVETGDVIYKDEFKHKPSAVFKDVFLVENEKGTYDYFKIDDVKTPINKESFYIAADFYDSDIAPAALPGKPITLINTDCRIVATLDKSISSCTNFQGGLAIFTDMTDKEGYIDTKGQIVIKAKFDEATRFSDGVAICTIIDSKTGFKTYHAIDQKGNELFNFNEKDYSSFGFFSDGYMSVKKGDNIIFIDKKGKKICDLCSSTDSLDIEPFYCVHQDNHSVFCEGDMMGLKDNDNNIVLRAKYKYLLSINDGRYIALKDDKYGVIDYKDETVIDFKYDNITQVREEVFIVRTGESYTLINLKGEDVTTYNFDDYSLTSSYLVKNNYINPKEYALKILNNFNDNSCCGYNATATLKDFKEYLKHSASYYSDEVSLAIDGNSKNKNGYLVFFDSYLSKRTYRYEQYYYYTYQIPTGYRYNYEAKLKGLVLEYDISEYSVVEDKIADEFERILKSKGYKELKSHLFESPKGTVVSLLYEEGIIRLIYYFIKGNYIDVERTIRKEKARKTPEGMPSDKKEDSVIEADSVAVDI